MIWCVEDDASIRDIEVYTLKATGFEAEGFSDGTSFFEALKKHKPELILLDIMLPGEDGVEILKHLREDAETRDIPVIMATAKGMEFDKVQALDLGADDYLVKPFGMMEMVSRVKAVLRRCNIRSVERILKAEELSLNIDQRTVFIRDKRIELTYKEFEILRNFLSHPGMVFTREQIYTKVWGDLYMTESRTVDMHIRTLRQKIGMYGDKIETVRNVGYRWEAR